MGIIVIAMYFLQVSWRFTSLNQLVNILTYVIEGLEEALREIISFIIRDENRPGRANSVRPKTYAGKLFLLYYEIFITLLQTFKKS